MPKKITLDDLAGMVKRGFDEQSKSFSEFRKENQKEHKQIKSSVNNLEFIATEMVRRDEFLKLQRKVEILEAKLAVR